MTDTLQRNEAIQQIEQPSQLPSIFTDIKAFENAQRMVKPLADSALVPDTFRGKIGDCMIALEMANRTGASPLSIMQNIYIVHGKPAWSSQFLIAAINSSGKFSPLRYTQTGKKGDDSFGMIAWAYDRTGERLEGPEVTIQMAKKEGWYGKSGSKWPTMPELMLRYRAATFFARLYCPEISMGMQTADEVIDITDAVVETPSAPVTQKQSRFARKERPVAQVVEQPVQQTAKPVEQPVVTEQPKSDVQDAEVVEETPFDNSNTTQQEAQTQQTPAAPYDAEAEAKFADLPISINDMLDWYKKGGYDVFRFNEWVKKVDVSKYVSQVLDMKEAK